MSEEYNSNSNFAGSTGYSGQSGYFSSQQGMQPGMQQGMRPEMQQGMRPEVQQGSLFVQGSNLRYTQTPPSGNRTQPTAGTNPKPQAKKPKKKGESFGVKLGKTAAAAAVFGLVAGGVFQGINIGADKLRSRDDEVQEALLEDKDDAYSSDDSEVESVTEEAKGNADNSADETAGDTADNSSDKIDVATTEEEKINVQQIAQSTPTVTLDYDVADIVASTQSSIVSITTAGTTTVQSFFQVYEQPTAGAGSGILIGQDADNLYIATNHHVIKDANEIKVGFTDGEMVDATVKGYDEDADIAVVVVPLANMKDSTKDTITIASVGDSDKLQVGEPAIAIGNALGYGQSVTVGYISALNRSIENSEGSYIQTDAAINPGNSGGALINSKGEVIGINSVKYVDNTVEGMGFSIPINSAMTIINDIIAGTQKGEVVFGVTCAEISKEYSMVYGFPQGIYVKEITPGTPAANSDLHTGDIIVEFDGKEVYTNDDLQDMLKKCEAGDTVELKVYRADDMGYYQETKVDITFTTE